MPSTLEITSDDKGMFGLFKGYSGAGKSTAALSFPKPYVFDFDKKMPTIAHKHFPGKDISYDTFKDIFEIVEKLNQFSISCPYETLIFDSVTHLITTVLNSIAKVKNEDVIKQLRQITKSGNLELMSIDYYNGETNFVQRFWLDAIKSLWSKSGNPLHVIVIAHIVESESAPDLKTKVVTKTRSILTAGRKVAAHIPTVFDDVYMFGHEPPEFGSKDSRPRRICITESIGEDDAKTSYNLPQVIDFTGQDFYKILAKHGIFGQTAKDAVSTLK